MQQCEIPSYSLHMVHSYGVCLLTVATAYACEQYYIVMAEPEWLANYLTDLIFQTSKWSESLRLYEKVISFFRTTE